MALSLLCNLDKTWTCDPLASASRVVDSTGPVKILYIEMLQVSMISFCVVKGMLGKGNLSRPLSTEYPCPLRTPVPCRPLSSADSCLLDTMLSTCKCPFLGFQCCHWLLSCHWSYVTSWLQPLETGLVFGALLLFASAWKCPLCSHLSVTSLQEIRTWRFPCGSSPTCVIF